MWVWTWAKGLGWWQLALFALAVVGKLGAPYLHDASERVPNTWIIPAYAKLQTVTGRLAPTYLGSAPPHTVAPFWGRLLLDDGSLFGFTCKPGVGDPSCAYTPPYDRDPNLGKRLQLRFFDSPNRQGPVHVLMEMRGVGRFKDDIIVSYADSRQRIEDYRSEAGWPSFSGILFWGFVVVLTPGLLNRIFTGREIPATKTIAKSLNLERV